MASATTAIAAPLPGGSGIYISPNLVAVNREQELYAEKMALSGFISPYLNATVAAVFGQGFEVNLYRDRAPRDSGKGDGSVSVIDVDALRPKSKLSATPDTTTSKLKKPAAGGDGGGEDDTDATGSRSANQATPFGDGPKQAESTAPNRPPIRPRFPLPPPEEETEKIPLSREERNNIESNWSLSAAEMFRKMLTVGGVVVRQFTDPKTKKKNFSYVPTKHRIIMFRQNTVSNVKRDYFVAYTDRRAGAIKVTGDGRIVEMTEDALARGEISLDAADAASSGTASKPKLLLEPAVVVQDNENNRGIPTMEGGLTNLIFYLFEPDDDGNITSPVFRSAEAATAMELTRYSEIHANMMRSQPMHVIGTGPKQQGPGGVTSGREVLTPGRYAQGDMLAQRSNYTYTSTRDEKSRFDLARHLSEQQGGATVGQAKVDALLQHERIMAASGEWNFTAPKLHSLSNMFDLRPVPPLQANSIVLPPGQTMMGGPQAENAGNYAALQEALKSEMAGIWEMPLQVLDMSGTKYASDAALLNRRWEGKKIDYWTKLSGFIATIWSAAHAEDAAVFTKLIRKALKNDTDTVSRGNVPFKVDLDGEKKRLETPEARQLNDVLIETAKKRKRSENEAIRKTLRVEVSFNVSLAGGNPDIVQILHQMGGIDTNTAVAIYGELGGIPRNLLILNEAERLRQRQTVMETNYTGTAMQETSPPPPRPTGALELSKTPSPGTLKPRQMPVSYLETDK